MFYKIKSIFNPINWLIPIQICIIIFCLGIIFTKYTYSANEKKDKEFKCIYLIEKQSLLTQLNNNYGEIEIFRGLSVKGQYFIEFFINPSTKSWTVLGTNVNKVCIFDFGIRAQIKKLGQGV